MNGSANASVNGSVRDEEKEPETAREPEREARNVEVARLRLEELVQRVREANRLSVQRPR
ncbi:hypothetical protein HEK616_70780 [Streptomyces nigrescens]|uniref:Uncharacterized protein n=1 Tax=Streptomyces nigrescens TaxID=1920 RepID=A0ABM8A4P1_STRNI|nr:hypothetical protein HEK616_70780 [Streptomyces nigrescens]